VKLDDIGLHLAQRPSARTRAIGNTVVRIVPSLLSWLATIGTAAMLWVGGGILLHGLEELELAGPIPDLVHGAAHWAGESAGALGPVVSWLVGALAGAVLGLLVGGVLVLVVRRFTKHPEELIVD
jgi:predicted DNA repair protein MutK